MASSVGSRPLVLVRSFLYFVVWVFSLVIFAVIAAKLYRSVFGIKVCLLNNPETSTSFCQWGIAAGVIGFVAYLLLDIAVLVSLFASSLANGLKYVELIMNAFFIAWYVAFAVVMSIGVSRFKSLTNGGSSSYVNTPAALSWISFVFIVVAEILVAIDFGKPVSMEDDTEPQTESASA
ncbi:hypothetical protein F1559_004866 [Cyanidiococcus yangmingshanensis]|uniref:MARVEL domain-containing protein n=1 Tax=Cyanidiococcus yangmingshanensis TaxID=2690220 RepID=A0A7J7IPQ9_9RHOD|nr:hypothetical protein F1559_004866 [Cyanidiococcus yangmingshanensis]